MALGAFREQSAKACASMAPRERYVAVDAMCCDRPARHFAPGTTKKKAPEGAFNMLRLVRQAD